jgi:hypothetical protein
LNASTCVVPIEHDICKSALEDGVVVAIDTSASAAVDFSIWLSKFANLISLSAHGPLAIAYKKQDTSSRVLFIARLRDVCHNGLGFTLFLASLLLFL